MTWNESTYRPPADDPPFDGDLQCVQVWIPRAHCEELRRRAQQPGASIRGLVRRAIRELLEREEEP